MQILVVDDDHVSLLYLSSFLEKLGHKVFIATSGEEALRLIIETEVRVVISDWNMPGLSGIDLCRQIRGIHLPRYVYFILLTARDDKDSLLLGMESGADDYLVKPVDPRELRVRLHAGERILNLECELEARNAELIRDVRIAAAMQRSLLPKPCQAGEIRFDWVFMPSHFVAGDMLGYYPLDEGRWAFFMLDVSGHGVASALISFSVSKLLGQSQPGFFERETDSGNPLQPSQMIAAMNRWFFVDPESDNYFITMVYGVVDSCTGEVTLSSAGHPSPLHCRKRDKAVSQCQLPGLPVGVADTYDYQTESFRLESGDRLFIYSDGLVECHNNHGEKFGLDRFIEFIQNTVHLPIGDIRLALEEILNQWRGPEDMPDDLSLLIIEKT